MRLNRSCCDLGRKGESSHTQSQYVIYSDALTMNVWRKWYTEVWIFLTFCSLQYATDDLDTMHSSSGLSGLPSNWPLYPWHTLAIRSCISAWEASALSNERSVKGFFTLPACCAIEYRNEYRKQWFYSKNRMRTPTLPATTRGSFDEPRTRIIFGEKWMWAIPRHTEAINVRTSFATWDFNIFEMFWNFLLT